MTLEKKKVLSTLRVIVSLLTFITLIYVFIKLEYYNDFFLYFTFFTRVGNFIIALGLLLIVLGVINERYYIYIVSFGTLIFIVYALLLSPDGFINEPFYSMVLHYITPLFIIIDFIFFLEIDDYKYKDLPKYTVIPFIYLFYVLIVGAISTEYPYFFLDVAEIGYMKLVINVFGILIFYLLISLMFTFIKLKYLPSKKRVK